MRPDARNLARFLPLLACCGLAAGCASDSGAKQAERPVVAIPDRDTSAALAVAEILDQLRRLAEALPAQQAEIVATAQREFELAPSPTHQLRYASMLTLPGIGAADAPKAQRLLRELTARPESLLPAERALAQVELTQVDHQLLADTEKQRLQMSVERSDREHVAALNKRLQAETDENAKLRKDLEEAQAKLDAVANIERSLSERRPTPEAKKP